MHLLPPKKNKAPINPFLAQVIVSRQQVAKKRVRMWPGTIHRKCNELKRPRLAEEEQQQGEDGKKCKTKRIDTSQNLARGNGLYLQQVRMEFAKATCIELIADASPFGSSDVELFAAYSPDINKAAFLSPVRLRRLKWRVALAGEHLEPKKISDSIFSLLLPPNKFANCFLAKGTGVHNFIISN